MVTAQPSLPPTTQEPLAAASSFRPSVAPFGPLAGSTWFRLGLAVVAGTLHGIGWLFPGVGWTVWLGQSALISLGVICPPRIAFGYGFLVGAIGIGGSFSWGIEALAATVAAPFVVALLIYALLVAAEALAFALFAFLVSLLARQGLRSMWLVPLAWVAIEFWFPRIFRWQLGYSQLEFLPILQVAELVGSTGIGFVMTTGAVAPVVLGMALARNTSPRDRTCGLRLAAAAVVLVAAALTFGQLRIRQLEAADLHLPKLQVATIQIDPTQTGAEAKLRERSLQVASQVDLICWPELAIGNYSEALRHFRERDKTLEFSRDSLQHLVPGEGLHKHLLAGGKSYRVDATAAGPYQMAAFLIGPEQDILGRYHKRTLLPLGEYVPGQSWFPSIRHWLTIPHILEAGTDPAPLQMSDGKSIGVLMCYEDTLPGNARHTVASGASVLISLIEGSAFDSPLTLVQHQRLAVARAVENRRYFVRCASTGLSCVVAPTGRVVRSLPLHTEDAMVSAISLVEGRTLYNRLGEVFPWIATIVLAAGLLRKRFAAGR